MWARSILIAAFGVAGCSWAGMVRPEEPGCTTERNFPVADALGFAVTSPVLIGMLAAPFTEEEECKGCLEFESLEVLAALIALSSPVYLSSSITGFTWARRCREEERRRNTESHQALR